MFGLGLGLGGKYGICIAGVRVCRCMCVVDRIVSTPVYICRGQLRWEGWLFVFRVLVMFFVNVTHHFQLDAYVVCVFYVMWHFVRHAMM